MFDFNKPKIEITEKSEKFGRFVVEPLERGYGTTHWQFTSRIMLSLPGAAGQVKIEGVAS